MKHEIEVKVLEIDKAVMIQSILSLGAEKIFEGKIFTIYYALPEDSEVSSLRLRKKGDKNYLTVKKRIDDERAKIAEEHEIEISYFEAMDVLLTMLGYKKNREERKMRSSYLFKDTFFEIDEREGIPAYMEIESPSVDIIQDFIQQLQIDPAQVKNWSGKELRAHYGVA